MINKKNIISNDNNFVNNGEIDFKDFFSFLFRNKRFISSISILFFFLFLIVGFTKKKIWEGQFQIVLAQNKKQSSNSINTLLKLQNNNFSNLLNTGNSESLKTQVSILQSPSVLKPVFDYVLSEKIKLDSKLDLPFREWKDENLTVILEKGTSVLNISYRDTKKDLILPVLNKISTEYQLLSDKNKKKSINLQKKYFEKQLSIYRQKSSLSFRNVQEYAIDKDLEIINTRLTSLNSKSNNISSNLPKNESFNINNYGNNVGIELMRINAANTIRNIKLKIQKIEDLPDNSSQIEFISSTIPIIKNSLIYKNFMKIENDLIELRSKYKENDIFIKRQKDKKNITLKKLREKLLGYLNAEKIGQEATMEAAMRPKEVLLKYEELMREAIRDEKTLINLENNYRLLMLDEARLESPWELIYKPTLKKNPVAPNKKIIALIGLFIGFIISSGISIFREKQKGQIYDQNLLENLLDTNVLEIIDLINNTFKLSSKDIFIKEILNKKEGKKTRFISSIKLDTKTYFEFFDKNFSDSKNMIINNIFNDIQDDDILILITKLGEITIKEVETINNRLRFINKKLDGIILLE